MSRSLRPSAPSFVLYGDSASPLVLAVEVLLRHGGIDFDFEVEAPAEAAAAPAVAASWRTVRLVEALTTTTCASRAHALVVCVEEGRGPRVH